jgi:hypothetical protein
LKMLPCHVYSKIIATYSRVTVISSHGRWKE